MLRKLQDAIRVMISMLCLLAAIAVMVSDIFSLDLNRLLAAAFMLSLITGSLPFFFISQTGRK